MTMHPVLITREFGAPLAELLEKRGLSPRHVPLTRLVSTKFSAPELGFRFVLVTSAAVVRFVPDLAERLAGAEVITVGGRTRAALEDVGVDVAASGAKGGRDVVRALADAVSSAGGGTVLHVGAEHVSAEVRDALAAWGHPVHRWAVYRNEVPAGAGEALRSALPCTVVTFAAASAVRAFAARAALGSAKVAVLGRSTEDAARSLGLPVHGRAARPTMHDLAELCAQLVRA